jgi:hypothetical protein
VRLCVLSLASCAGCVSATTFAAAVWRLIACLMCAVTRFFRHADAECVG